MKHHQRIAHFVFAVVVVSLLGWGTTAIGADGAAALYAQQCASCHGDTGKGDGAAGKYLNPKPGDFAVSLKGKTDAWIAKAIKGGGPAVGEAAVMPASSDLSDPQIKEMVDYIKKLH
jgi:mono/diheme cytochrome c family protein